MVLAVGLTGCGTFSFDSNLNPRNFAMYEKETSLKTYKNSELYDLNYVDLGTVEGISCQIREDDIEASEYDAKMHAKELARKKNANGIIFSTCVELVNTPACLTSVSCYARIVSVDENEIE